MGKSVSQDRDEGVTGRGRDFHSQRQAICPLAEFQGQAVSPPNARLPISATSTATAWSVGLRRRPAPAWGRQTATRIGDCKGDGDRWLVCSSVCTNSRANGTFGVIRWQDGRLSRPTTTRRPAREKPRKTRAKPRFPGCFVQSGRPDSDRRHPAWEASALPTELRPQVPSIL